MANSSALLKTVTGPAHTVTNTWEANRNVLDRKENKVGTTVISSYDYTVNTSGQRTDVAQAGSAFAAARGIVWGYDPLGQLTSADSTENTHDRAYQYDLIGNRLKTADSLTLPPTDNYTPNALNQYTSVPSVASVLSYDPDGNMTSGPLPANLSANSTLGWDAENRLVSATLPGGATVSYTYDSQSRRIAETVGATTKLTIYDGWNPIAEYVFQNSLTTLHSSYLWGMDLSGSMQGAGGVGGLLAVHDGSASYYPTYDGNGNVSEYLDSSGVAQAHYEYDAFGNTIVATGGKAGDFEHRFSTKPLDAETGLYYYGYRFYDPLSGRWPSRDPIGERGGVNLYAFVGNNGVNWIDILGEHGWQLNDAFGRPLPGSPGYTPTRPQPTPKAIDWQKVFEGVVEEFILDSPSAKISINHTFPLPVPVPYFAEITPQIEGRYFRCKDKHSGVERTGFEVELSGTLEGGIGAGGKPVPTHQGPARGVPRNSPAGKKAKKLQGKQLPWYSPQYLGGNVALQHNSNSDGDCICPDEGWTGAVEVGVRASAGLIFTIEGQASAEWTLGDSFEPDFRVEGSTGMSSSIFPQARAGVFGTIKGTWTKIIE